MAKIAELEKKVNDHEVKLALIKQSLTAIDEKQDSMCDKIDKLSEKLDLSNKVEETHQGIISLIRGQNKEIEKTGLRKAANTARDIVSIVTAVAIVLALLAFLLKADLTQVIK